MQGAAQQAPAPSLPRVNDPAEESVFTVPASADAEQSSTASGSGSKFPVHVCSVTSPDRVHRYDAAVIEASKEACLEWLRYERDKYRTQIEREFSWQAFSTRAIFVTVLALVALGALLACVQFWIAMRLAAQAGPVEEADPDADGGREGAGDSGRWGWLSSNVTIGPDGVSLRSSFLGVVLLVISLAFFYLYLVHVYPIRVVR